MRKSKVLTRQSDILGDAVTHAMCDIRRMAMRAYPDASDVLISDRADHELRLILSSAGPDADMFDVAERAAIRVGVSVTMGAGGIVMVSCTPSNLELGF